MVIRVHSPLENCANRRVFLGQSQRASEVNIYIQKIQNPILFTTLFSRFVFDRIMPDNNENQCVVINNTSSTPPNGTPLILSNCADQSAEWIINIHMNLNV